jgi:hypothetical protein
MNSAAGQDGGDAPPSVTHPAVVGAAGIVFAALALPAPKIGLGLAIVVLVWRRIAKAPRRDILQALAVISGVVFLVLSVARTNDEATDSGRASETRSAAPPRNEASPGKVIVVDNRVTSGKKMREDEEPARLTTKPVANCERRGCDIANTERESGDAFDAAVCQRRGEEITNGDNTSLADDDNPGLVTSTRYYGVRLKASDTFGYVNEVWIARRDRGGLGLPTC